LNNLADWITEFKELNPVSSDTDVSLEKKQGTLALDKELMAMDYRDKKFYHNLSPEHKKEISLWVLMRYMSSSAGNADHHLLTVNDLVNHNFGCFAKHPELQWILLSMCGTDKRQFHQWIAAPRGVKKNKLEQALLDLNPLMKQSDIELLQQINSKEAFEEYFKDNGFDDKTIKEILKNKVSK